MRLRCSKVFVSSVEVGRRVVVEAALFGKWAASGKVYRDMLVSCSLEVPPSSL